jgi:hypothetical protein
MTCQAGQHWVGIGPRVLSWTNSLPADRVRLGVRDEGVYRVSASEIAAAAGVTEAAASNALDLCGLTLTCQGRTVAWTTAGDALYFYGVPTAELFAPENVYWLTFGAGLPMGVVSALPAEGSATNSWFMYSASYRSSFVAPTDNRDRRSTHGTITNVLNFGESVPYSNTKSQTLALPGFCAGAATGVVARVSLASYRDFPDTHSHACEILVNGVSCGVQSWPGEQAVTFDYPVPQGAVSSDSLTFDVRNPGTSQAEDFLLLDVVLFYPRTYRAEAGSLLCAGGAAQTVATDGFSSDQVAVWDITQPDTPEVLEATVCPGTNGTWQAVFACGDAAKRYALFDVATGYYEPSVSGVRDTPWGASGEMPELAIVIPPQRWIAGFAAAVQPLADFRNAQGLRTRVIDAEELYNAFSDGLVHPKAFQLFSAAGVTNGPSQTLRYMLFAGYGGSDYKLEVFKLGSAGLYPNLFPLYLFSQIETPSSAALMLPNDVVLGNATGGAVPEVAVGRFIATNVDELTNMVAKTIRYELTETWKNKAIFAACKQLYGNDPDFSNIVANTAARFVSDGWSSKEFYPRPSSYSMTVMWEDTYRQTGARYELDKGSGFLYYFGHSSDQILGTGGTGGNYFLKSDMLKSVTNAFAPVALLLGCRLGRWTILDMPGVIQCVCEAGIRNKKSGFAAAIGPTGYIEPEQAVAFSYAFGERVAAGALRLGDVWRGTFAALGDDASAALQHMALLGDPSLVIRAGVTARGTPSAWLIAQGMVNNPYADLLDQDGDGFETWREYQAGTSPVQNALRVHALSAPSPLSAGLPLSFEPMTNLSYRVMSTTNLVSGLWEPLPWRPDAGSEWLGSGIPGDSPVKAVEVPFDGSEPRRFYKVETY